MRSIVKEKAEKGLWFKESPEPEMGPLDVLIKIKKTSICGTDLSIYKWSEWAQKNVPVPLIVGHEFVGEIVDVGQNVKGFKVGDRVSGEGHLTCGVCPLCRNGEKHLCFNTRGIGYHKPGCFADYFVIPAENVFPLPDFVKDNEAAIFDPFGNAVHTALSFPLIAKNVLITGAGPIGIMAAAIAKKAGARHIVVTDVNPYRLELAKKMGADAAVNTSEMPLKDVMSELNINYGFNVGMEMSGNPNAFHTLLESMQNGGKVALLGILPSDMQIDWDLVIFKMLTLKGIYGREIFSTWTQMVNLLESGLDLSPIITHEFPAEEIETAIQVMQDGNCGKIILNWD